MHDSGFNWVNFWTLWESLWVRNKVLISAPIWYFHVVSSSFNLFSLNEHLFLQDAPVLLETEVVIANLPHLFHSDVDITGTDCSGALSFSGRECNNRPHVNHIMLSWTCMTTLGLDNRFVGQQNLSIWNRLHSCTCLGAFQSLYFWIFPYAHTLVLFFDFIINQLETFLGQTWNIRGQMKE